MAADVSSSSNSEILITRDLLGALSQVASTNDLDLNSKPGMVYTQRCNSPNSPLSPSFEKKKPLEESCLELKLLPSSSSCYSQSVCTLDKVKSALQRAAAGGKEETLKKRFSLSPSEEETLKKRFSLSPSEEEEEKEGKRLSSSSSSSKSNNNNGMFAAGCPGCLMYVMTLKANPICPNCNSTVPLLPLKKPRIDLNASF